MISTLSKPIPVSKKVSPSDSELKAIYCDGSSILNHSGGWGVVAYLKDGSVREIGGYAGADSTNQTMELQAGIRALELIKESGSKEPVTLFCDSQYVINCATKWLPGWKRRGWVKADGHTVLNLDLVKRLDALSHVPVKWEWVRGHNGNEGNERADRLATECRKEQKSVDRIDGAEVQSKCNPIEVKPQDCFEQFSQRIRKEFIEGSAIAPDVFDAAVDLRASLEINAQGDPISPIHEALGWRYARFGYSAQNAFFAAIFHNEDGSVWQAKPSNPQKIGDKLGKYLAPKANGNRAYLPPVSKQARKRISERYGVSVPSEGSFWDWVENHPEIPITVNEGAKKTQSQLSLGIVALSLYGCSCGNSPDLERFLVPGRRWTIAFDQDESFKTRQKVSSGVSSLAIRIGRSKGIAKIATWDFSEGKGFDDLVVQSGATRAVQAIDEALSFAQWKSKRLYEFVGRVNHQTHSDRMTDAEMQSILASIPEGIKLINLRAQKGWGKTYLIAAIVNGKPTLVLGHRNQLMSSLANRLGIPDLHSLRQECRAKGTSLIQATKAIQSLALCVDSFQPESDPGFLAEDWFDVRYVVIDEVEQVILHLLQSETLQGKKRIAVLQEFVKLIRHWASPDSETTLITADADLSYSPLFFAAIAGRSFSSDEVFTIRNDSQAESYPVSAYEKKEAWFKDLKTKIEQGQKILIKTSSQSAKSKYGTIALENYIRRNYPHLKVLRIDSETLDDRSHAAFGCMANLNQVLGLYDIVICSPSIETGVSIDLRGHFDAVFGYMAGNLPENSARQFLARLREPVIRHLYIESSGNGWVAGTGGETSYKAIKQITCDLAKTKGSLMDAALINGELDHTFLEESLDVWALMVARVNIGMFHYAEGLLAGLTNEGCKVTYADVEGDIKSVKAEVEANQIEVFEARLQEVAEARLLSDEEFRKLDGKSKPTAAEQRQAEKYTIAKRYATDEVTTSLAGMDACDWYSAIRLHYFLTVGRKHLSARDAAKVNAASKSGVIYAPDFNRITISDKIAVLDAIGFTKILQRMELGESVLEADEDLQAMRKTCLEYSKAIKRTLGVELKEKNAAHTMLGKLLKVVGLSKWRTSKRVSDPKNSVDLSSSPKMGSESPKPGTVKVKAYSLAFLAHLMGDAAKHLEQHGTFNPYELWALDDGRYDIYKRWSIAAGEADAKFTAPQYKADRAEQETSPKAPSKRTRSGQSKTVKSSSPKTKNNSQTETINPKKTMTTTLKKNQKRIVACCSDGQAVYLVYRHGNPRDVFQSTWMTTDPEIQECSSYDFKIQSLIGDSDIAAWELKEPIKPENRAIADQFLAKLEQAIADGIITFPPSLPGRFQQ